MPSHASRILITGSSGFIGTHLVRRFREKGWDVLGIGRRPLDETGYLSHDLSHPLPTSFDRPFDVVIHAAARSNPWGTRREFENDNVVGTQNVIDYCLRNGTPKLIYLSSSSVYYRPEHQWEMTEETPLPDRHVNLYAATKRRAEELVRRYPSDWAILRPRAVFGPGDTVLLPRIIRAARAGRLPMLVAPDGPAVGDLIYVDNLVDAVETAATRPSVTGVFNLTNNQPVPIIEFLFTVFEGLGILRPQGEWSEDRRTVLVTLGTHLTWAKSRAIDLLQEVACLMPDTDFHFSRGMMGSTGVEIRGNLHLYDCIRYDAAIVHGGTGITYACITQGVPMLVWPHDYDQFDHAARIVYHQLGRRLPSSADQIACHLQILWTDPSIKDGLQRFQSLSRNYDPCQSVRTDIRDVRNQAKPLG